MAPFDPWLGFWAASVAAAKSALDIVSEAVGAEARREAQGAEAPREWATPHRIVRELATMRVLEFSNGRPGATAIIVAPYAVHSATTADFARHHSVVGALLAGGVTRLRLTDWKSAVPEARYFSIDTHLADLNVAVDDFGAPAALVGLCQGGWLAAAYAARFPAKVRSLALAAAPIDITADASGLGSLTAVTPRETMEEMLALGDGRLLGRLMLAMWPAAKPGPGGVLDILQLGAADDARARARHARLQARFDRWHAAVVDLPGVFYRQTVDWMFRENRLAAGRFVALGERLDLSSIVCPIFLLAAEGDEITRPGQCLALARLAGTPPARIETCVVQGGHLSLFMGQTTLATAWRDIARFVAGRREPVILAAAWTGGGKKRRAHRRAASASSDRPLDKW